MPTDHYDNKSAIMLTKQLVFFLSFFDYCGFNTQHLSSLQYQKRNRWILILHVIAILYSVGFNCYLVYFFASWLQILEVVNESIINISSSLTYLFIIFDSNWKTENQSQFWKLYDRFGQRFYKENIISSLRFYSIIFVISFVTSCGPIIVLVIKNETFIIYSVYWFLSRLCHLRISYQTLCLKLIHLQLKLIKRETESVFHRRIHLIRPVLNDPLNYFEINRLKCIRQSMEIVREMVNKMNNMFGWTQLLTILFGFQFILNFINWIYLHFFEISPMMASGNI